MKAWDALLRASCDESFDGADRLLEVRTGSRLHFGLLELAADAPYRFGGLGLMVAEPHLTVRVGDAIANSSVEVTERIQRVAAQACSQLDIPVPEIVGLINASQPRLHAGLGAGTQLACAVAKAIELAKLFRGDELHDYTISRAGAWQPVAAAAIENTDRQFTASTIQKLQRLAQLSGRGKRSAIGLHGFLHGGLVADHGYGDRSGEACEAVAGSSSGNPEHDSAALPHQAGLRPLNTHSVQFPSDWPVVLILPRNSHDEIAAYRSSRSTEPPQSSDAQLVGKSSIESLSEHGPTNHRPSIHGPAIQGEEEEQLLNSAGRVPNSNRSEMLELASRCLTAATSRNFDCFITSLERYMILAGQMFSSVQSGIYRDEKIEHCVRLASAAGLHGVGQSSWGPTVFGFASEKQIAERAANELQQQLDLAAYEVVITEAAASGAQWCYIPTVEHA